VRHRSTQLGWLAVAVLSGALGMAWINASSRAAPAGAEPSRAAAGLGAESHEPASCDETGAETTGAAGQCSARANAEPAAFAGKSVDTGARVEQPGPATAEARPATLPASPAAAPADAPAAALVGATTGTPSGSVPPATDSGPTATPLAGAGSTAEPGAVAASGSAADGAPTTPTADLPPFNAAEARSALASAALSAASSCQGTGEGTQLVPVTITFAPSGRATSAIVTGSVYQGTAVGGCIAQVLRATRVSPFAGDPVAVQRTVTLQ
jgi:hypothetical protein